MGIQMKNQFVKKQFTISVKDALRVIDALELAASWDKTEIYYELKNFVDENTGEGSTMGK
jgi:hypothetical protein